MLLRSLVLGLALLCLGCTVAPVPPGEPPSPVEVVPTPRAAPVSQPVPVAVSVASIGARGRLIPLGLDARGGWDEPPVDQPELGSWYTKGPRPGAQGPAVILGHVNGNGRPGLFSKLSQLSVGDEVEVSRADGSTAVFSVYRVQTYPKTAFPTTSVLGKTESAELRLITCGGAYDSKARRYLSNVIAFARFVRVSQV